MPIQLKQPGGGTKTAADIDEHVLAGSFLIQNGDLKGGLKKFEEGLAVKRTPELLNCKADVLLRLEKKEEALACADEALRLDKNFVQAWVTKAEALLALNHCYSEVIDPMDKAIRLNPDLPEAWETRSLIASKFGDHQASIDSLGKFLELKETQAGGRWPFTREEHEKKAEILCRTARQYAGMRDYNNAIRTLSKAFHLDTSYATRADEWCLLGDIYSLRGRENSKMDARGFADLRKALKCHDASVRAARAAFTLELGDDARVYQDLHTLEGFLEFGTSKRNALQNQHRALDAVFAKAETYYALGEFSHARRLFKKLASITNNNVLLSSVSTKVRIHDNLGLTMCALNDFLSAAHDFDEALELIPKDDKGKFQDLWEDVKKHKAFAEFKLKEEEKMPEIDIVPMQDGYS